MISIKPITTILLHVPLVCTRAETASPVYDQAPKERKPATRETEAVVYGGASAGSIAAIQAARMGRRTTLISFNQHVRDLTSGGGTWRISCENFPHHIAMDIGESEIATGVFVGELEVVNA